MATRRIVFVTYGAGHVRMVLPVIQRLQNVPDVEVEVFGLTTAAPVLEAAGVRGLGFRHLLAAGDCRARQAGRRLAESYSTDVVPHEETVAYLGLSYVDLEERLGREEAARHYAATGRHGFLPVTVFERYFRQRRPDLVIATNSPRAERAAVLAAGALGIPSICLCGALVWQELNWISQAGFGTRVCVLSDYMRQALLERGRSEAEVVVTGSPAYDELLRRTDLDEKAAAFRRKIGCLAEKLILWISQPEPERHPFTGAPGNPHLPQRIRDELCRIVGRRRDWRLVVRPHPNENGGLQGLPPAVHVSPQSEDLAPLLKAADVVVLMSSSVGIPASFLQTPLVVVGGSVFTPDTLYLTLRVALGVERIDHLQAALCEVLDHGWRPPEQLAPVPCGTERVLEVALSLLDLPGPESLSPLTDASRAA
jgi:hypothetical protein